MLIRLLVVNVMLFSLASAASLSAPHHARVGASGELSLLATKVRGDAEHLIHGHSHTAAPVHEAADGNRKLRREVQAPSAGDGEEPDKADGDEGADSADGGEEGDNETGVADGGEEAEQKEEVAAETNTKTAAAAGDTKITVESLKGVEVGQKIKFGKTGDANFEAHTVIDVVAEGEEAAEGDAEAGGEAAEAADGEEAADGAAGGGAALLAQRKRKQAQPGEGGEGAEGGESGDDKKVAKADAGEEVAKAGTITLDGPLINEQPAATQVETFKAPEAPEAPADAGAAVAGSASKGNASKAGKKKEDKKKEEEPSGKGAGVAAGAGVALCVVGGGGAAASQRGGGGSGGDEEGEEAEGDADAEDEAPAEEPAEDEAPPEDEQA